MATPVLNSLTDNSARDGTGDVIEGAEIDANPNTLARILDGTTETMLNQDTSASDGLRIRVPEITDISAAAGGIRTGLRLRHDPSSGTVGDNDGIEILIQGDDDAGNKTSFAEIETYFTDVSNGSEDGDLVFKTMIGGTAREMLSIGSPGFIVNEDSQDLDFRLETNNIANGFTSDGGLDTFAFGKAAVDDKFVSISTPAASHTATTDTYAFHVAPGGAQTIPSGTTALVASAAIEEPNITATGTVTSAATLYIKNAPTEGSSNYALWVDDGAVQIDSNLTVGGNITVTGGMTVAGANAFDIGDSDKLLLGDSDDLTVYHDGSNSYITNATGALKLATETSGIAITIGHGTSETTVADNLTVTGTTTATGGIELSHASANTLTASSGILSIEGVAIPTISSSDTLTNKTITSATLNTPTITGNTTFSDGSYNFNIASHDGTNGLSLAGTVVTATAAELNLIDGGTSRGTTAVASGDGILINDGGTMRMTNVDTVSTYFASHNVGGSNIVTTGALNSGSITSGFGTIDTGSSTITTTGAVATGALTATGAITATDTTAPLILKYDAGEYVTHAVSSAGVYSIATTDASSDSGAITLDTVDSITLDSDTASEGIVYADGGTNLLRVSNSSSDVIFKTLVDAKDIVFQQYDGNEVCRIADNRRLYFYDEGGEYISSSGSALTIASGSAAWELPAADGSDGQILKTDGSGNLDWVSQTSGATLSGSTDNTVVTVTGSNAMQGESNLTFDGSTLAVTGALTATGNVSFDGGSFVFNEAGADKDFRIEGDSNANLFFADASTDRIGIGSSSPIATLEVAAGNNQKTSEFWGTQATAFLVVSAEAETQNDQAGITFNATKGQTIGSANSVAGIAGKVTNSGGSLTGDMIFNVNAGDDYGEKMRLLSSGRLGIGTSAPSYPLEISASDGTSLAWQRTGGSAKKWGFVSDDNASYFRNITDTVDAIVVSNAGSVGIGTATVGGSPAAGSVQFHKDSNNYVRIWDNATATLYMQANGANAPTTAMKNSDSDSLDITTFQRTNAGGTILGQSRNGLMAITGAPNGSFAVGTSNAKNLVLGTNNTAAVTIDSSQRVGINRTPDLRQLEVGGGIESTTGASAGEIWFENVKVLSSTNSPNLLSINAGGFTDVYINNNVGIDTSSPNNKLTVSGSADITGNLGIGTTSPSARLHIQGTTEQSLMISKVDTSGGIGQGDILGRVRFGGQDSDSGADLSAAQIIGYAGNAWSSSSRPSEIQFYTQATTSSLQRAVITQGGEFGVGATRDQTFGKITSRTANDQGLWLQETSSSLSAGRQMIELKYDTDHNATDHYFIQCTGNTTTRARILSTGAYESQPNSYGGVSDEKLKQDIVDARNYWDDFKQIQFRKFRFKNDVLADANAPAFLGVVAQEIESVFPGLVTESPDTEQQRVPQTGDDGEILYSDELDDNGDPIPLTERKLVNHGTTTKSVKYSVLGQIGLKVVQELQTRLESAEAKITALEAV